MVNPVFGFQIKKWDVRVTNRTGATLALGDVCMFDLAQLQAETTSISIGDDASSFANVGPIDDTAEHLKFAIFAVATESIADNRRGLVRIRGHAMVKASLTGVAAGDGLVVVAGDTGLRPSDGAGTGANDKVIALALEAITNGKVGNVLFDGMSGFGPA